MIGGWFLFWRRWLLAVCGIVAVFGLAIALLSWSLPFGVFNDLVDDVFWPGAGPDAAARSFRLWAYGMLGATMAGWGTTLAYVVTGPFAKREQWSWDAVAAGLCLWFVVDTLMSVYTRAYFNLGVNALLFVLAGLPLLMTRRDFFGR